jgi:cysteine synthase A
LADPALGRGGAAALSSLAGVLMSEAPRHLLDCIGDTALVRLRHIVPAGGARLLLKLESGNPTGSVKDRMARAMIAAAEADGRLAAGAPVVEYTGGSTGVSLAFVCAASGHPLHIVSSDAFAREKLDHMTLLGARLHLVPSDGGRMTAQLTRDMVEAARAIAAETGAFWTDQLRNADQLTAYRALADEIWTHTGGRVDAFVQSVGTAGSLRGTAEGLRSRDAAIQIVAVEPAESAVLSGGPSGAHKIDGVGAGFVVPLWRDDLADRIEPVSTADAVAMSLRLAREEGLFAGTSTGANVVAALRVAAGLGPHATVVTVACDTGMKYLKSYGAAVEAAAPPRSTTATG